MRGRVKRELPRPPHGNFFLTFRRDMSEPLCELCGARHHPRQAHRFAINGGAINSDAINTSEVNAASEQVEVVAKAGLAKTPK